MFLKQIALTSCSTPDMHAHRQGCDGDKSLSYSGQDPLSDGGRRRALVTRLTSLCVLTVGQEVMSGAKC